MSMKSPWAKAYRSVMPACVMAAAGLVPAASAWAQDAAQAAPSAVGEVVVTAERRTVSLQKVDMAVSAVSAAAMDKNFVTQISDLSSSVPGLEVQHAAGMENLVTMRGVGSQTPESTVLTTPGVSEFIDGVYIANNISLDQTLFDVDHIEVLRGPQGSLYGESSIGGVINIVSKQPRLQDFSGSGDVSVGDYNLSRVRGEINLPIGDEMALRLSVQKYDHDGFTKDALIPGFKEDDAHDYGVKGAFLWRPTDALSATFTAQYYRANQNGAAQKDVNDPNPDPRVIDQDFPGHFELTNQLYHLNTDYEAAWFNLRSVTAYQQMESPVAFDSSRSAVSLIGQYDDVPLTNHKVQNYSEEFDLVSKPGSPVTWAVGAFFMNQKGFSNFDEYGGDGEPVTLSTNPSIYAHPPSTITYGNVTTVQKFSYAGFGQFTYPILPDLRLTGGVRYNYDSTSQDSYAFSGSGSTSRTGLSSTTSLPTGTVRLDYDATSTNLVYASVTRGYKPGGTDAAGKGIVLTGQFLPETNTAFEVGSKNQFLDRTVTLNLAGYYYLYDNAQYLADDTIPYDGGITNIPHVHAYGVEAEGSYVSPDRHWHIDGNVAWEHSEVAGKTLSIDSTVQNAVIASTAACNFGGAYYNPACWAAEIAAERNIQGKALPNVPEYSAAASIAYDFDTRYGTLTPRASMIYRGDMWARIFNEPSLDKTPSYTTLNLNLTYLPNNSHFKFSIQSTNVTNVAGVNSQFSDPFGTFVTSRQYIPPRQVIATVAYSF